MKEHRLAAVGSPAQFGIAFEWGDPLTEGVEPNGVPGLASLLPIDSGVATVGGA